MFNFLLVLICFSAASGLRLAVLAETEVVKQGGNPSKLVKSSALWGRKMYEIPKETVHSYTSLISEKTAGLVSIFVMGSVIYLVVRVATVLFTALK